MVKIKIMLNLVSVLFCVFICDCSRNEVELPTKGVAFTDSLYGTTITRISDKDIDGYVGNGIENEYAKADAYNSNESYLILRSNDGTYYLYHATDYQLVDNLDELGGGQELEPRWHTSDPNVFYFLSGTYLKKYDLLSNSQQSIHNFQTEFPNCSYITTGVEGDASQDQRYWCFMVVDSVFNLIAACVYDMTEDSVVGIKTSFPGAVNFTTIDASGNHAVLCYDALPFQSFSRDFSQTIDFVDGAAGHSDIALTSDGADVIVYQNIATDYISMTDLATGTETQLVQIPFDVNTDIGMHISGNCYTIPGWVLVSTYGAKNPVQGESHSWMDNLLFMVELKENPRIIKLAETHCYTGNTPRSNYFAEAFASINRTGTKIVFGSNWGVLSPEDYTDAYEVVMPSGWNQ